MPSQPFHIRLSAYQREILHMVMQQWGCKGITELLRAFARVAAVAGPPSQPVLKRLHEMEQLPIGAQDLIDERILTIAKAGALLRGPALEAKLEHLLRDPSTVHPPRPFACVNCQHKIVEDTGLRCKIGEDMLAGTPCPTTAQKPEVRGDDQHWDTSTW